MSLPHTSFPVITPTRRPPERHRDRQRKAVWPSYLQIIVPSAEPQIEHGRHALARRALNISVALIGILVTLPVWIAIAILIKLTSRGPVFHVQTRVGVCTRTTGPSRHDPRRRQDLGGRPFRIYKFRTMRVGAELGSGPVWASPDDPRVTAVGGFLRQFRLDELPQLVNVLKGDMNVVGPRPERPVIFSELREAIPNYQLRQKTRPGITGLAQVRLKYDTTVGDVARKVEYDLEYIQAQSFWRDLRIMVATIPAILLRKGW